MCTRNSFEPNPCVDLIHIRRLSVIGVLGPSVDYASTGTDLRKALRLLYRGNLEGNTILYGFDLLYFRLASHTHKWKEFRKAGYQKRKGLAPRTIQKPTTPVRTLRDVPHRHPLPRAGIRSVRAHKPAHTSRKGASSSSPRIEAASSSDLHTDPVDVPTFGNYHSLSSSIQQLKQIIVEAEQPQDGLPPDTLVQAQPQALVDPMGGSSSGEDDTLQDDRKSSFSRCLLMSAHASGTIVLYYISEDMFPNKMSLLHYTIILLHARQQGRSLWRRWSLVGKSQPFSYDGVDGYQAFAVAYSGNLLPGLRLIKAPDDIIPPKGKMIFCIFGCKVGSDHKWLCRQAYVSLLHRFLSHSLPRKAYGHQTIRRSTKKPACQLYPPSLLAKSADEFCCPREIDNIDIFYRYDPTCS